MISAKDNYNGGVDVFDFDKSKKPLLRIVGLYSIRCSHNSLHLRVCGDLYDNYDSYSSISDWADGWYSDGSDGGYAFGVLDKIGEGTKG